MVALAATTIMKRNKRGKVFDGLGHDKFDFFFLHATKLTITKITTRNDLVAKVKIIDGLSVKK